MSTPPPLKLRNVLLAERALWVWATFVCLWGLYRAWHDLPGVARQLNDSAGGMIQLEPQFLLKWLVFYYVGQAAATMWFILKIGEGKHWARSSFLWCFVLEILWMIASCLISPDLSWGDIPDIGLQACALYLLYTKPGSAWFEPKQQAAKAQI